MDDLIAFLKARLDERERAAHAATPGPWSRGVDNVGDPYIDAANGRLIADLPFCHGQDDRRELDAAHIAANDPAYVLADVAAKRQIIALHVPGNPDAVPREGYPGWPDRPWLYCETCGSGEPNEYPVDWPCATLRLLALPYADHPDYRQEWTS